MSTAPPQIEGVEHKFADLGEFRVHYAEAGDPDGDPVLLLHGWPQHWYEWRQVIPPLADAGYRVLCPDLRGFGWSEAPGHGDTPENYAADQIALLDALGIERTRVMGHDWGGLTTLFLGIEYGERIESSVALSALHLWTGVRPTLMLEIWRSWYALVNAFGPSSAKAWVARWILTHGNVSDPFSPDEIELFTAQFREPERAKAARALYRDYFRLFARGARGEWSSARLTAPTLLLFGVKDLYVSPKLVEPPRGDHGPLRIELVPDSGHFIVDEKPELVADRALAHFAKPTERSTVGPA